MENSAWEKLAAAPMSTKRTAPGVELEGSRQSKKGRQVASSNDNGADQLVQSQMQEMLDMAAKGRNAIRSSVSDAVRQLDTLICAAAECQVSAADLDEQFSLHNSSAKLGWIAPMKVAVVGSFEIGTSVPSAVTDQPDPVVDVAVCMPASCFQAKDYLDHKYTDKRTLYLSNIFRLMRGHRMFKATEIEHSFYGDNMKPVLTVRPETKELKAGGFSLRILVCLGPESQAYCSKLLPSRNLNRGSNRADDPRAADATPHYNNRILEDLTMLEHGSQIRKRIQDNFALADGIILAKVWLLRRRLHVPSGGLQTFQIAMIMCYLQDIGAINGQMSPWHMFNGFLTYMAQHVQLLQPGLLQQSAGHPLLVSGGVLAHQKPAEAMALYLSAFEVVLLDSSGQLNIMARLSKEGFAELQLHTSISLAVISDEQPDSTFSKLFATSLNPACLYDLCASVSVEYPCKLSIAMKNDLRDVSLADYMKCKIANVSCRALGTRAELVRLFDSEVTTHGGTTKLICMLGMRLNPQQAERVMDVGPAASDEIKAKEFRSFWGSKSEMRRLKDGSIVEAAIWSECADMNSRHRIVDVVLKHALSTNLDGCSNVSVHVADGGTALEEVLGVNSKVSDWQRSRKAFDALSKMVRNCHSGVDGLPLAVVRVTTTSARLARCSAVPPRQHPLIDGCTSNKNGAISILAHPIMVLIEFEGNSQWPADDVRALRAIKTAMLVRLGETLRAKFSIDTQLTRNFMDVFMQGHVFRVCISHGREVGLIQEDIIKIERTLSASDQQRPLFEAQVSPGLTVAHLPVLYAEVLALEQQHVFAPAHTNLIGNILSKHPTAARTIRLAKRWLHAHMFSGQISNRIVELIVCHCYTLRGAAPHSIPSTQTQGFARFLLTLQTHAWAISPLIVELDSDGQSMNRHLDDAYAARNANSDVPMFVVTTYATDQSVWTDSAKPSMPILKRLQKFAKATSHQLELYMLHPAQGDSQSLKSIFNTPSHQYDAIIHLNAGMLPAAEHSTDSVTQQLVRRAVKRGPFSFPEKVAKNLITDQNDAHQKIVVGLSPARAFVEELRAVFGSLALFFCNDIGGTFIGVIWKPALWIPHRGRTALKLQTFSHSLLVPQFAAGTVKAGGATLTQKQPAVSRNVFEIMEQIRRIGEGLVDKIETSPQVSPKLSNSIKISAA